MSRAILANITLVSLLAAGCFAPFPEEPKTAAAAKQSKPSKNKPPATAELALPTKKRATTLAASHILISYQGAQRSEATRTRTDAKALAMRLADQLSKGGKAEKEEGNFDALARKHSDCSSSARGGSLGSWPRGQMVPRFEAALDKLKPGQITRQPIETAFGFHIIKREEP